MASGKPFSGIAFSEKSEIEECNYGTEIWNQAEVYEGEFFRNTTHGEGVYRWRIPQVYEGSFFANRKEGYATLSFPNNSFFQGLFINNEPFGPGILTHANGTQDVGFWLGQKLVRLIREVDLIVPRLATTSEAKTKLLKFRSLVCLSEKNCDSATEIQKKFNISLHRFYLPYSRIVSDPRSIFFDRVSFENKYFSRSNFYEESEAGKKHSGTSKPGRGYLPALGGRINACAIKILPRSLSGSPESWLCPEDEVIKETEDRNKLHPFARRKAVSWNENKLCTDILKYIYRHRGSEKKINLDVEKLVSGVRHAFRRAGENESRCLQFLKLCSLGPPSFLRDFLCNYAISEELIDARGNNGLMFAAASDQHDVIDILSDYGVDVNAFNDENLTPLNLCLLRRLAIANKISNWGEAFFPPEASRHLDSYTPDEDYELWEFDRSFLKVFGNEMSNNEKKGDSQPNDGNKIKETKNDSRNLTLESFSEEDLSMESQRNYGKASKEYYLFELDPTKRIKENNAKIENFSKGKENSWIGLKTGAEEEESDLKSIIEKVDGTIEKLLKRGADPNISEVPKPSIHLGIFTKDVNLVQNLLSHGAHPDSQLHPNEGCLTPLHVLALLEPSPEYVEICEILLKFGANPEEETLPGFSLIGNENVKSLSEFTRGSTPLQLLCMRPDFENANPKECLLKLALLLATASDEKKLWNGNFYLKLAMLHGNTSLVRTLLQSKYFDSDKVCRKDLEEGVEGLQSILPHIKTSNAEISETEKHLITSLTNSLKKVKASKRSFEAVTEAENKNIEVRKIKRKQKEEVKNETKKEKSKNNNEIDNKTLTVKKKLKNIISAKKKNEEGKIIGDELKSLGRKKTRLQKREMHEGEENTSKSRQENQTVSRKKKTLAKEMRRKKSLENNSKKKGDRMENIKDLRGTNKQENRNNMSGTRKKEKREKIYKATSTKSKEIFTRRPKRLLKEQRSAENEDERKIPTRTVLKSLKGSASRAAEGERGGKWGKPGPYWTKGHNASEGQGRVGRDGPSELQGKGAGRNQADKLLSSGSEIFPQKRRRSFLKMFGNGLCLDNDELLLPYVVLRDGNLYYRFQGKATARKEQYSLI